MAKFKKHFTQQPTPTPTQTAEPHEDAVDLTHTTTQRPDLPVSISADGRDVIDRYRALYAASPDTPARTDHMHEFAARFCASAKLDPKTHISTIIRYLTT